MSYEPTEWKSGDVITSAKLNKIENGIHSASGGVYIVNSTYDESEDVSTLDKTAAEILAAAQTSYIVAKEVDGEDVYLMPLFKATHTNIGYSFIFATFEYFANAADGYPKTGGDR